jgi:ubiquinone/menaquinone biosynthesis C-methylase UbiE
MAKTDYGIDAPGVIRNLAIVALAAALLMVFGRHVIPLGLKYSIGYTGGFCGLEVALMLWTSLKGKRVAARQVVDRAELDGDARVLDVGCGRGLLLIEAAKRLKDGRAVGLDIWNAEDLSGNRPAATEANAKAEGVADRVELVDGNAMKMPFGDGSFDAVLSSLCIHNLYRREERALALSEIARVLKPGGRAVIQDFRHTGDYVKALEAAGLQVERRLVNPLLMFPPTWRVVAKKT